MFVDDRQHLFAVEAPLQMDCPADFCEQCQQAEHSGHIEDRGCDNRGIIFVQIKKHADNS